MERNTTDRHLITLRPMADTDTVVKYLKEQGINVVNVLSMLGVVVVSGVEDKAWIKDVPGVLEVEREGTAYTS